MKINKWKTAANKTGVDDMIDLSAETPSEVDLLDTVNRWIDEKTDRVNTFTATADDLPELLNIIPEITGKSCVHAGTSCSAGKIEKLTLRIYPLSS